jgi:long-chain acyl-CoA synthetase
VSAYDDRPWLARYGEVPADLEPEFASALEMFRDGLRRDPTGAALVYFDGGLSRTELDEQSDALASALLARGFARGDRLAVYLQNVPQFVVAMVATWKAGGVMVSINPMSRARELSYLLADSGAKVLLALEALYDEVARDVVPGTAVELVLTTSELEHQSRSDPRLFAGVSRRRSEGTTDLAELVAEHRGQVPPPVELGPDEVAFLTYTSGTTGVPKGAMNTHRNVVFTAQVYRDWARFREGGSVFGVAPLFHITGLIGHVAISLLAPMPLVLAYRFEPQVVLDALLEHRPTCTIGAITALNALLAAPGFTKDHFSSFTSVYSGGAAISPTAERRFFEATGTQVHNAYGLTETTSPMTLTPFGSPSPVDPTSGALSVGVPAPSTVVRIRSDQGRTCRSARSARSSRRARRSSPGTGASPSRRRSTCPAAPCAAATSASWTPTAGCSSSTDEGHDQRVRLQGVAARGRGRAGRAPGGARVGGRRGARRAPGETVKAFVSVRRGRASPRTSSSPTASSGWPPTSTRGRWCSSTSCRRRSPARSCAASCAADVSAWRPADGRLAPLDHGGAQRGDDLVRGGLGHLDEREALGDLDAADLPPGQARLAGDRADEVLRRTPGGPAEADEQPGGRPSSAVPCAPGRAARTAGRSARSSAGRATCGMSASSSGAPPVARLVRELHAAAATSMTSNSSVSASTTARKPSRESSSRLSRSAPGQLEPRARRSATVGTFSIVIFEPVARSIVLSIRCSRGSASVMATPSRPGAADPADPVDVRLRARRHVVVHDVGEVLDVEPAGGDVGGDEQVGGLVAQASHHLVALLLAHAAVQRLGAVAAPFSVSVSCVDLLAGAAEDERASAPRRRAPGRGRSACAARATTYALWRTLGASPAAGCSRGSRCAPGRAGAGGRSGRPRRHGRGEQHRLPLGRRGVEDRLDVLGEAHVEHLVGLVEHDVRTCDRSSVPREMWSSTRPGVPTTTSTPRSSSRSCRPIGCRRRPAAPARRSPAEQVAAVPVVASLTCIASSRVGASTGRPARCRVRAARALQQRQREGRVLPVPVAACRAGPALEQRRDRLALDGGRLLVAERRQRVQQLGAQARSAKVPASPNGLTGAVVIGVLLGLGGRGAPSLPGAPAARAGPASGGADPPRDLAVRLPERPAAGQEPVARPRLDGAGGVEGPRAHRVLAGRGAAPVVGPEAPAVLAARQLALQPRRTERAAVDRDLDPADGGSPGCPRDRVAVAVRVTRAGADFSRSLPTVVKVQVVSRRAPARGRSRSRGS